MRDPQLHKTIRLLTHRLRAVGLWRFVEAEEGSSLGCLHARVHDPQALRRALSARPDFTAPKQGPGWESRHRRHTCALHIKHFRGWPADRLQFHLDLAGLPHRRWWWLCPPLPAALLLRHGLHYRSYRDVDRLWRVMERRGEAPLTQ